TTSIGPSFGSLVASPSLGFLYAHSYRMESDGAPGERDMSELAPSIVLREGKPILVIGGAGRERIPSAVLQVMINVIDRQMTLERAVLSPRVFLTKNTLRIHDAFLPEVMQPLSERFRIEKVELGAAVHLGLVHAVRYDPETREFFGAADLGDSGSAMAPAGSEQRKRETDGTRTRVDSPSRRRSNSPLLFIYFRFPGSDCRLGASIAPD